MDPTLALLMGNMAQICRDSIVYDPFVGSGGVLLACAHYGAFSVGSDMSCVSQVPPLLVFCCDTATVSQFFLGYLNVF